MRCRSTVTTKRPFCFTFFFFVFFATVCYHLLSRSRAETSSGVREAQPRFPGSLPLCDTVKDVSSPPFPITPRPLLSPPWLPSLHPSLRLQRIACPLLEPFPLLGAHCSPGLLGDSWGLVWIRGGWVGGCRTIWYCEVRADGGDVKVCVRDCVQSLRKRLAGTRTTQVDRNDVMFFQTRGNKFAGLTVLDFWGHCQVDLPAVARGGSGAFN